MNIEIANRLVQLRRAHGLSQEVLSAQLGVSRQAVSKWERAESAPDTDNLIALAKLYGISLDGLLLNKVTTEGASAAYQTAPEPPPQETPREEAEAIFAVSDQWDEAERKRRKHKLLAFPFPVLVVAVYLALGFGIDFWHPGWMMFFSIPFYYCWAAAQ